MQISDLVLEINFECQFDSWLKESLCKVLHNVMLHELNVSALKMTVLFSAGKLYLNFVKLYVCQFSVFSL